MQSSVSCNVTLHPRRVKFLLVYKLEISFAFEQKNSFPLSRNVYFKNFVLTMTSS